MFTYPLTARNLPHAITASAASSVDDYDFLIGHHAVHHKKLKERLNNCQEWIDIHGVKDTEKVLNGVGNIEKHYLASIEAMALRLFNPATRLWSLYWADSIAGTLDPPLTGSFDGHLGVFFGKDTHQGKEVLVQFQYDRSNPDQPVWGQAFSVDNGATWEWNWLMFFSRHPGKI